MPYVIIVANLKWAVTQRHLLFNAYYTVTPHFTLLLYPFNQVWSPLATPPASSSAAGTLASLWRTTRTKTLCPAGRETGWVGTLPWPCRYRFVDMGMGASAPVVLARGWRLGREKTGVSCWVLLHCLGFSHVVISEWLFTKMFQFFCLFICCCCNYMFYDWSECVMSVLGTTKPSLCNQCIDTWQ